MKFQTGKIIAWTLLLLSLTLCDTALKEVVAAVPPPDLPPLKPLPPPPPLPVAWATPIAFPQAPAPDQEETTARPRRTEFQVNYETESVSRNNSPWRLASLDFKRDFATRSIFYGALRAAERFGQRDQETMLGIYQPLGHHWAVNAEASAGLGNRFLPRFSLFSEVERVFPQGWVLHFGGRYTAFQKDRAAQPSVTVEKYFGNYRAAYSLSAGILNGHSLSVGQRFQLNRYYGEQNSTTGVLFAFGQELENTGTNILRSDSRSLVLLGTHWLTPHWGFNYQAGYHQLGNYYRRKGFGFGLRLRY